MSTPLRVLFVEDSEDDALLLKRNIERGGYDVSFLRVDCAPAMKEAIERQTWDIVISDYSMPGFSGLAALALVKERGLDAPFIIVSGNIGEDIAVEAMKSGAADYVMKTNLARLVPAITRELRDADMRRERKYAEEELRESEDRYRTTLEGMPDAVGIMSVENARFLYVNNGFTRTTGFPLEEVIGRTIFDLNLLVDVTDQSRFVKTLKDQMGIDSLGLRFRMKDGTILDSLLSASRVHYKGIDCMVVVVKNITTIKQAEEEKHRLESQLAQAQKMEAIGTLAGGIAHDFNNILSAIIGYTELAIKDLPEESKVIRELREVLKAGDRAKDLVSHILTFSRKSETVYSPLTLPSMVKESLKMMRSVIPTTIEIRQDLLETGMIMSDPTQIHQVVMNLCTNAAHAMDESGGVLTISLKRVNIDRDMARNLDITPGPYLNLTVSDTGHGMTPEIRERIFDPYFTTKGTGRGTGMGLSVVLGIVKSHRGAITCRSTPGKGTDFDIYLPEIESVEQTVKSPEESPLLMGTERILFIDDEPVLADLAEKILVNLGYVVCTQTSSVEALKIFRKDPAQFDLVITDMTMPEMTGEKLARNLMDVRGDIPVILCTGYSEHISEEKAKRIGVRAFIMKPYETRVLAETLRKVLDGR